MVNCVVDGVVDYFFFRIFCIVVQEFLDMVEYNYGIVDGIIDYSQNGCDKGLINFK